MTRINLYAEELTTETEMVTRTVNDEEFGERTFYGVRFFLKSLSVLHHSEEDDDRSAVTLWVKWTKKEGCDTTTLRDLLRELGNRLYDAEYDMKGEGGGVTQRMNGAQLIATERARQINEEGFDAEHDSTQGHRAGQMVEAAICYAMEAKHQALGHPPLKVPARDGTRWPWDVKWWKPSDPIRMLVKAGALIAAEIDRLTDTMGEGDGT